MSQVIIGRKAGQQIPEDFLKLCPTKTFGVAIVDGGKLETMRGSDFTIDMLRATEDDYKDKNFTLYLSDADKATNLNDVSPYDLIGNDDDEPLLSVFIAGNFPGFMKEKSSHSPAYHLAGFIAEHCETVFDAVDKDLAKLVGKIGEDRFKEKIKMNAVSHGFLTFVAQNGATLSIAQGAAPKEFPWGWFWSSEAIAFGEKKEEKAEDKPKKKGLFANRSTVREKVEHQPSNNVVAAAADKPKPTATAVKAPAADPPPSPKQVPLSIHNITIKTFGIPANYPRKLAKKFIKGRIGHIPPNYMEEGAKFQMYVGPDGKNLTLAEVHKALGIEAAKLTRLDNPKAPNQKDVEPKHIDSAKLVSNPLPILSPSSRDRLTGYISDERIKKIIGENSGLITDPDNVQGYEGKIVPLWEQMGMKDMKDFDALPFKEFEAIGRTNIHDLAVMCWTYKVRALKAEFAMAKLKPKKTEAEHKEEHVLAKEELAPKKKGLFAKRAAA